MIRARALAALVSPWLAIATALSKQTHPGNNRAARRAAARQRPARPSGASV